MHFFGLLLCVAGAGLLVLLYGMHLKASRLDKLARLYQQALERGLDPAGIRLEPEAADAPDPQGNLKGGILLLAVAGGLVAGVLLAGQLHGPLRALSFACVPAAAGLGLLLIHALLGPRPGAPPAA